MSDMLQNSLAAGSPVLSVAMLIPRLSLVGMALAWRLFLCSRWSFAQLFWIRFKPVVSIKNPIVSYRASPVRGFPLAAENRYLLARRPVSHFFAWAVF